MPKTTIKSQPVLRVRIDKDFAKEMDEFIVGVNRTKPANPIDRSHLVREAVLTFLRNKKSHS